MSDPQGNTASLIQSFSGDTSIAINEVSDTIGILADLSGAGGLIAEVVSFALNYAGLGTANPVLTALQNVLNAVQNVVQELGQPLSGNQLLERNQTIVGYLATAQSWFEQLPLNAPPPPLTEFDLTQYMSTSLTYLGQLTYSPGSADLAWNVSFAWGIYWNDQGQYMVTTPIFGNVNPVDVGYGQQAPPLNSDGLTTFVPTYALPAYLYGVTMFLGEGRVLDPNFIADYASELGGAAAVLLSVHQQFIQNGFVTLLPPNWAARGGFAAMFATGTVPTGVRYTAVPYQPPPELGGPPLPYFPASELGGPGRYGFEGVVLEYGAVERFTGTSSIGANYQLDMSKPGSDLDPGPFNKLQIRALKRTKDVYLTVGLRQVRQVINQLRALVGDGLLQPPYFEDWSLREVCVLSQLPIGAGGYSLTELAKFIILTPPLDTTYTQGGGASGGVPIAFLGGPFSLITILTQFND